MPIYTAPHADPHSWYPGSLSEALRVLSTKGKAFLPQDIEYTLADAASLVFIHESRVNLMRSHTPADQPISSDPFFVFNGYKDALKTLMFLIGLTENEDDPVRWKVCTGLSVMLHDVLAVLRAQGFDYARIQMNNNKRFTALSAEFDYESAVRSK